MDYKPYIIRAMHEYYMDVNETCNILVDATNPKTHVPMEYVKEGKITLNISYESAHDLHITNEYIMFDGRFGGESFPVTVPIEAVIYIFSKESQHGIPFNLENHKNETIKQVSDSETNKEINLTLVN